jgi:mannitol/fructose-specific phosphotransferase system IIA component (Ntr-type)
MIELKSLIQLDCIRHPLEANDPHGAIRELVELLHEHGHVQDADGTTAAVWEREQQRTTGIGNGLAVPHGRCPSLKNVVAAIGWTDRPIDFKSSDGSPVTLVAMIISPPEDTSAHVQALGAISLALGNQEVRAAAMTSSSAEDLYALLCNTY